VILHPSGDARAALPPWFLLIIYFSREGICFSPNSSGLFLKKKRVYNSSSVLGDAQNKNRVTTLDFGLSQTTWPSQLLCTGETFLISRLYCISFWLMRWAMKSIPVVWDLFVLYSWSFWHFFSIWYCTWMPSSRSRKLTRAHSQSRPTWWRHHIISQPTGMKKNILLPNRTNKKEKCGRETTATTTTTTRSNVYKQCYLSLSHNSQSFSLIISWRWIRKGFPVL
jgi:hypothetical protein